MIKTVFIAVLLTMVSGAAMAAQSVLVLHSYHQGNEWRTSIGQAMESVLRENVPEAELFIEEMDSKRHPPETIFPIFKQFLADKYAARRFDVILCSDDNALDFLLAFRDELFPGVPVVFCGINNFEDDRIAGRTGFTGVAEEADLRGTLELALQLHPKTRQVAVITDSTPSGRATLQRMRKIAPFYAKRVEFRELAALSAPQLRKALAAMPPHSIILLLDYFRDDEGRYFTVAQGNNLISGSGKGPVYSAWDFRIKAGVVGGRVVSGRQQGEIAAGMALRILNGESPADIPVLRENPNEYLFDHPALARFHIPLAALPKGSRILNQPRTSYSLGRKQLLVTLMAMSLVTLALMTNFVLRRRAEKALKNSQARLRAIHDNAAAGIALTDRQGRYLEINDKWAEMFGSSPHDIIGKSFLDLTFPDDRDENCQEVQDLLQGKKGNYRLQKRFTRENGTVFWVDNSVTPVINELGEVEALVGVIIDITDQKQTEEQLRAANRELDAFVRTASHDLRSPLTIIIGYAEYLQKEYRHMLDEQGTTLLSHMAKCAFKMHELLEDLLAFAQVGYVENPRQPVDADEVALEAALAQSQKAGGMAIERAPLPAVRIPRSFLLQVFDNLVGNAVRYAGSAGGPIEIGGEVQEDQVRYFVRDHGPGVAAEERQRIFEPFYRGAAGKNISGTGIGLATVQKIARLYGGRAWLEETPGGGCTFWVEMRDIRPERNETSTDPAPAPGGNPDVVPNPDNLHARQPLNRSSS
jgi:PAS domain S-box-containing protein